MMKYTICGLGGIMIFEAGGGSLGCAPSTGRSVRDNLLSSMRFVADIVAGKIDNKEEATELDGFIEIAVDAMGVLAMRLRESNT